MYVVRQKLWSCVTRRLRSFRRYQAGRADLKYAIGQWFRPRSGRVNDFSGHRYEVVHEANVTNRNA